MTPDRWGRQEQAVAHNRQADGGIKPPGEVDHQRADVADEQRERNARDADQELRHVTGSLRPSIAITSLVSSDPEHRPKK